MESLHWYKSEKFDPNNEDDMYWVETDPEIREYQQLYDLSPKDHILYLVSAEKNAIRYWKVGITKKDSAKKRDPKHYLETFRETYHHGETAESIELAIAQTFAMLHESCGYSVTLPPAREGLSYAFAEKDVLKIYDFWVDVAKKSERCRRLLNDFGKIDGFQVRTLFMDYKSGMLNPYGGGFNRWVTFETYKTASVDLLERSFGWCDCYERGTPDAERLLRKHADFHFKRGKMILKDTEEIRSMKPFFKPNKKKEDKSMWN